jgi:tetratricopeptide (TPR) repeat protein
MNRVETAIKQGRCVLAIGTRALAQPEVQAELRRRAIPVVALGNNSVSPAVPISVATLYPATHAPGGVVVLVEPESSIDGRGMGEVERAFRSCPHKPLLVIAAPTFNPFGLPMTLRLAKLEQEKKRALEFLAALPVTDAAAAAPSADNVAPGEGPSVRKKSARAAKPRRRAPLPVFVGREEELGSLKEMLNTDGGPIVLHGPPGIGRRWLVERALQETELERIPDVTFARGTGFDYLVGRIALVAKVAGDNRLHEALTAKSGPPTPAEMSDLIVDILASDAFANKVLVMHRLHDLQDRRDGSFYRNGRLETTLRAVFQSTPKLRIVAISDVPLCFYREGEGVSLRQMKVGGLKGRELHEQFEAFNVPEFSRDRFGPIFDRTHGHPVASRCVALSIGGGGNVDTLLENPRYMKAESVSDLSTIHKNLKRRLSKLDPDLRAGLAAVALCRSPVDNETLGALGIKRDARIDLLAHGWLEQTPNREGRKYYVHPLVMSQLTMREIEDFGRMETLAQHLIEQSKKLKSDGQMISSFALAQEGNRLLVGARRGRSSLRLPYPDNDAQIDELRGLMRRRTPRLDIARMRINDLRKAAQNNGGPKLKGHTEFILTEAELLTAEGKDPGAVQAAFDAAIAYPTPEVFHTLATWHQNRNARGKACQALEQGIATFPNDARLHRRLAGFQLALNRPLDAIDTLKNASDIEPMMPDTYGMLGEIYLGLGTNRWEEASQCIAEARRLAPHGANHMAREADMLRRKAMGDAEQRDALLEAAETLLREAMTIEKGNRRVLLLLASVILDRGGDLEQAQWLLKQLNKQGERRRRRREDPAATVQRARLLVRQAALDEAERLLQRLLKGDAVNHAAHAIQGEVHMARGQLLPAHLAFKTARERCPMYAPEAAAYDATLASLQAHIESGLAILPTAAVSQEAAVPKAQAGTREGSTIRRRKEDGTEDAPQSEEAEATGGDAVPEPQVDASADVADASPASSEEQADASAAAESAPADTVEATPVADAPTAEAEASAAPADGDSTEVTTDALSPESAPVDATDAEVSSDVITD